jgi:FtsP/CotA-like multicopper oxidase with cupredoxin domain
VSYEWTVPTDEPEGTHYFHSHGKERPQTNHGLFGAVVVEPLGSTWIDPRAGRDATTSWDAVIRPPDRRNFREYVLYYHEVGDESFQPTARDGTVLPLVDPLTSAYRPGGRAINYRSEPFMNRLALQQSVNGYVDESLEYSSYAFGDPATPIMRSYLGEPVKQRVVHAGSEVFHVHHVHGGGTRWIRQPGVEPAGPRTGLDKHPPLVPLSSERTDSQSLGPSETFDVIDECGSGGCQQSAGDFMFHCHVTHHYFAGMWGIWRVYNTLQDGPASTDSLPPLPLMGDAEKADADVVRVDPAVTSDALVGRTVDSYGKSATLAPADLAGWVERQLPPAGMPKGYDASVFDSVRVGDTYRGEPETTAVWPGYRSRAPGARPAMLFDPVTGRLAYPFLRPHLARRPPFAPNHGPAPFLDPVADGVNPPAPGENGPGSVCPAGTKVEPLPINVISTPAAINARNNLVDGAAQVYVLRDQEDAVRADPALGRPLAIRANAGEDCIDVFLRSELSDDADDHFSKVSAHIHFVQFDIQASDGVDLGFNYEQSVRPFASAGERVTSPVPAGASVVAVADASRFSVGSVVGVGMDRDKELEIRRVTAVDTTSISVEGPLAHAHGAGEIVSAEFVRYRWYPDVQFGTAFVHDHVNVIRSSRHGLFGALIAEPPGSTYHDPHSGAPLRSGIIADIHTDRSVSADVRGSFREVAMFIQDDSPFSQVGRSTGSALSMRAEPLDERGRDPTMLFNSAVGGDPMTPMLEAYLGDPLVIRTLVGANNDVHSWHLDGHWFRKEPWSERSPPIDTIDVGISERYDLAVPRAGGPQAMSGDYLYYSGRTFKLREGSWGLVRVYDGASGDGLRKLPGHENPPAPASAVCPADAPVRQIALSAVDVALPMLGGAQGKMYVLDADRPAVMDGRRQPEPLVLHANVGDCLRVQLRNTTAGPVSFHADMLAYDPATSGGVAAGREPAQAVAPGATAQFTYYASPEVGETVALVRDWGDVTKNPGLGLYGAIVVGPRGARYRGEGTRVEVKPVHGAPYRDFTLFFQDEDESLGTHRMPYDTKVRGVVGLNYQSARPGSTPGDSPDPPTPVLEAYAGDAVKMHVLAPWSEQSQVFSIEGHQWPTEPDRPGTNVVSSVTVGGLDALTLDLAGGAGGPEHLAGDYLYGDHRLPYQEAGLWGLLRVLDPASPSAQLHPISGGSSTPVVPMLAGCVLVGAVIAGTLRPRPRRRRGRRRAAPAG